MQLEFSVTKRLIEDEPVSTRPHSMLQSGTLIGCYKGAINFSTLIQYTYTLSHAYTHTNIRRDIHTCTQTCMWLERLPCKVESTGDTGIQSFVR